MQSAVLLGAVVAMAFGIRAHAQDESVRTRQAKFGSGGKPISVEVFAPADDAKHPAVIVLHGAGGIWLDGRVVREFARRLAGHGYTAFVVHYFERTGTWFANDEKIFANFQEWRATISDAITFAAQQPEAASEKVGLFGYSLGAFLSLAQAARDTRVGAVVEVAGGFGPKQTIERMPPVLILHGRDDRRVLVSHAVEVEQALKKMSAVYESKIYEGEGHILSQPALIDAITRALAFFDGHLSSSR